MKLTSSTAVIAAMLALTGCPSDDVPTDTDNASSTGDATTSGGVEMTTTTTATTDVDTTVAADSSSSGVDPSDTEAEESSSDDGPPPAEEADFVVTIENVSNTGLFFSPLSPGMWANHEANADAIFQTGVMDDGEGLEALAEDGDPTALSAAVGGHPDVLQTGVFDTPVDGGKAGGLLPGDRYEFTFTAQPGTRLSLATMLVGSNDLFVGSGPVGISLFAGGGQPLGERDVSSSLRIWDAGTEITQAPGQGPSQAIHGGAPDIGPPEVGAGVFPHGSSTRAIPLGPDLIDVQVADDPKNPGTFIITITNTSLDRGTLVTALSPIVWALHNDAIEFFTEGMPASGPIEALAEDGQAGPLAGLLGGSADVEFSGVLDGPAGIDAPILPNDSVEFTITPTADFPYLNLATMVVQSNDAFLSVGQVGEGTISGVPLFDEAGTVRDNQDIEADILAHLTPWDAGTELNEAPGVGLNQQPRQAGLNTGDPDPQSDMVRRYSDVSNDLGGENAGGFLQVTVAEDAGDFTITINNTSNNTVFPGFLAETLWVVHDDTVGLFELGMPASPGLELLAEDGDPTGLLGEVMPGAGIADSGVVNVPVGGGPAGNIAPGEAFEFTVTPDATHRFLSFAGMIVPSNDTFAALDPGGVALIDAGGALRTPEAVAADISTQLRGWDAGTERNQAGGAGRDMAPVGMPNTGPSNGDGLVRDAADDAVWSLPAADGVIRVIVAPASDR
ncbi:MAG: spondin domain-containing protein [Myxococcota bacterium]